MTVKAEAPPVAISIRQQFGLSGHSMEQTLWSAMDHRAARFIGYTFSHPFYRASAESLLDAATSKSTAEAISLVDRALFTISPYAAKAAATNLGWVYQNLDTQEGRERVKQDIQFQKLVLTFHQTLNGTSRPIPKDLSSPLVELVRLFIEKAPPRHWSTYDVVLRSLRSLGIDDEPLTKEIEERRSKGIDEAHKRHEHVVPKLEQWEGRS